MICLNSCCVEFDAMKDDVFAVCRKIDIVTDQLGWLCENLYMERGDDSDDMIRCNTLAVLRCWYGDTYIGSAKVPELKEAFQGFFVKLHELLVSMYKSSNKKFVEIATEYLYQGVVYRYLGHCSVTDCDKAVEPEFNDVYVSWSKLKSIEYVESKLCGTLTHLTCTIDGDYFGIDLDALGISLEHESEVVFPTFEDCIQGRIEYMSEAYVDED